MSKQNSRASGSTREIRLPEGQVDQAAIAELAYRRWVEKGCPQGTAEQDWLAAEAELRSSGKPQEH
jgi:hypothetical protein